MTIGDNEDILFCSNFVKGRKIHVLALMLSYCVLQDSLFFLKYFFDEIAMDDDDEGDHHLPSEVTSAQTVPSASNQNLAASPSQKPGAPPPVMTLGQSVSAVEDSPQDMIKFDEMLEEALGGDEALDDMVKSDEEQEQPVFFKYE